MNLKLKNYFILIFTIKIIPKTVHPTHIDKTTIITAIITLFKVLSIEDIFNENVLNNFYQNFLNKKVNSYF